MTRPHQVQEESSFIDAEWLDLLGPGDLLPPSLKHWRRLLVQGLLYFLNRLPAQRRISILAAQFALDAGVSPAERLVALLRQCPTLHKLGQVVARQPHLDPGWRPHLLVLESMPAEEEIRPIVERLRTGLADTSNLAIGATALAQASVALVLPFSWREGERTREGVLKVVRPGVKERLADELALLPEVADFLTRRGAELELPALDYRDILEGVGRLLAGEIRLDQEQAHLREAASFYAEDERILVPELLPWSAPWVTAMERVPGKALTEAELSPTERLAYATTAMSALLARPFWSLEDPAVFHGDLHGGNLLITPEGRLAVLDWALTARVTKRQREAVVAALIGGLTLDAQPIRCALRALGAITGDERPVVAQIEQTLDLLVRQGGSPGFDWLLGLLDGLALDAGIRFDPQLSVFRKTWLSLSGVLTDLAGEATPDKVLFDAGRRVFMADWPRRWFAWPGAQNLASHLSNADLAAAMMSGCFVGARYWQRGWFGKARH